MNKEIKINKVCNQIYCQNIDEFVDEYEEHTISIDIDSYKNILEEIFSEKYNISKKSAHKICLDFDNIYEIIENNYDELIKERIMKEVEK